jgi:hypothetical protein
VTSALKKIDAGRIAARPRQARNKTMLDRIVANTEYYRDRTRRHIVRQEN